MNSFFIPPFIKEFLPYISTRAMKVISLRELGTQALSISRRMMTGEGTAELTSKLMPFLCEGTRFAKNIEVRELQNQFSLEKSDESTRKEIGDRILGLYFRQLKHSDEIFLDLRARHFSWSPAHRELLWSPSPLWIRLSSSFKKNLMDLYAGFYLPDEALLDSALEQLKLLAPNASDLERGRMKDLLRTHFGAGDQKTVRFEIAHLKDSFHEIFGEIEKNQRQLPTEFAFLGVYLTSLYLHLEALGVALDARAAYENA